ncbi:hypothetical protein GUJ93_ZPchr0005g14700 [Zizania palustris]|uniref:Uncharacterized protein n=1 Tax=Zizania palustris TaxID=103762 RepID=A0A8J5S4M7_ZIZPA|nr:hypothetical protein GUJ93_ZPchr0005g14700 [Zizania palustris]
MMGARTYGRTALTDITNHVKKGTCQPPNDNDVRKREEKNRKQREYRARIKAASSLNISGTQQAPDDNEIVYKMQMSWKIQKTMKADNFAVKSIVEDTSIDPIDYGECDDDIQEEFIDTGEYSDDVGEDVVAELSRAMESQGLDMKVTIFVIQMACNELMDYVFMNLQMACNELMDYAFMNLQMACNELMDYVFMNCKTPLNSVVVYVHHICQVIFTYAENVTLSDVLLFLLNGTLT